MRKILFIFILVLICNLSASISNYFWLDDVVFDARSASIGNTSLLTTNGSNTLFTNPALLSKDANFDIKLTGRGRYQNEEQKNIDKIKEIHKPDFRFGSFALSKAITNNVYNIGLGVGVNKLKDFVSKTTDGDEEKGSLNMLSIGLGIDYKGVISAGIAYNSSIESERQITQFNEMMEIEADYLLYSLNLMIENVTIAMSHKNKYDLTSADDKYNWTGVKFPAENKLAIAINVDSRLSFHGEIMQKKISEYELIDLDFLLFKDCDDVLNIGLGLEYSTHYDLRVGIFRKGVDLYSSENDNILYEYGYTLGYGTELLDFLTVDLYLQNSYINQDLESSNVETVEIENIHFNFGITLGYNFNI